MNFSQITIEDKPQYLSLLSQLSPVQPGMSDSDFINVISDPAVEIYGIYSENTTLVAIGSIYFFPKLSRGSTCMATIEDIVVDEQCRGHGIGKQLIENLVKRANDRNCYKCLLSCKESNVKFYEKCGFDPKEITMMKYNP